MQAIRRRPDAQRKMMAQTLVRTAAQGQIDRGRMGRPEREDKDEQARTGRQGRSGKDGRPGRQPRTAAKDGSQGRAGRMGKRLDRQGWVDKARNTRREDEGDRQGFVHSQERAGSPMAFAAFQLLGEFFRIPFQEFHKVSAVRSGRQPGNGIDDLPASVDVL
jgi:hypothetical protein